MFEKSPKMCEASSPLQFVFVSSPEIIVGAAAAAEKISQLRLENFAAAKIRSYKIRFATENFVYNFGATKFSENLKFRRITSKLRLDFFRKIRYNTSTVNKEKRGIPNVYNLFRYGRYNC